MNPRDPISDAEAYEIYAEPDNRYADADGPPAIVGPPKRRAPLPVRFGPETVVAIRDLARAQGTVVSAWIRTAVDDEIARSSAPASEGPLLTRRRDLVDAYGRTPR